jgi:hypothetical protein
LDQLRGVKRAKGCGVDQVRERLALVALPASQRKLSVSHADVGFGGLNVPDRYEFVI